jgi:hypothetical protein
VRECNYTTLLMSTGLTFGTISALFGLTHGYTDPAGEFHTYISQEQYSILVTVVIASAIVPTLIAQTFFKPQGEPAVAAEIESLSQTVGPADGSDGAVTRAPSPDPSPKGPLHTAEPISEGPDRPEPGAGVGQTKK